MVQYICHPEFWRKLMLAACDMPEWQKPIAMVLASGALLSNTETRASAGKLMGVLSRTLDAADHARLLEDPIRRAAALFPPDAAEWRERAVDQLLGCLDVTRAQDPELRSRLTALLAAGDPPQISEPREVEMISQPVELVDILGGEVHDELGDGARDALDKLRSALDASQSNSAESPVTPLANALERVVVESKAVEAEPVRELITRAAERLARDPSVQPGTDLGELVAQILTKAATEDGEAS